MTDRKTEGQKDGKERRTGGQTVEQTEGQTDRWTEMQTKRQMD